MGLIENCTLLYLVSQVIAGEWINVITKKYKELGDQPRVTLLIRMNEFIVISAPLFVSTRFRTDNAKTWVW